jgi:hypothetical protein
MFKTRQDKKYAEKPNYRKYTPYIIGFLSGFIITYIITYLILNGGFK